MCGAAVGATRKDDGVHAPPLAGAHREEVAPLRLDRALRRLAVMVEAHLLGPQDDEAMKAAATERDALKMEMMKNGGDLSLIHISEPTRPY